MSAQVTHHVVLVLSAMGCFRPKQTKMLGQSRDMQAPLIDNVR
jgi:hypothetical protein